MTQRDFDTQAMLRHRQRERQQQRRRRLVVGAVLALLVLCAAVFGIRSCIDAYQIDAGSLGGSTQMLDTVDDNTLVDSAAALPTPIMAESSGIELHCAVAVKDLTEILIHNASYTYANAITTELTEATNVDVMAAHGTGRVASEQPTGDEWMTGEFIRTFRSTNAGPRMSAIDCGAAVGSVVYAPVSGTVVLVKSYKLYDEYDDIQIHIQPDGRDDLDVVLIHLTAASVQAGDRVEGGVTPIACIRDVYAYIGDSMQLRDYTAEGDNGNHTHIQINDATAKNYHGLDDVK